MSTPSSGSAGSGTVLEENPLDEILAAGSWECIVWDDPVNLMNYVTHVFCTYFKYPRAKAEMLMMEVHTNGKAAVASGSREEMERDVNAMHSYGLWATVARTR